MTEHPKFIPFNCRCGQKHDIPLAEVGKPVECKCGYVSTDVPATVTEYVGVCSRKLIQSIADFGGLPERIPRNRPPLNKQLQNACTIAVCYAVPLSASNKSRVRPTQDDDLADRIKELLIETGTLSHTLDLYLPLSTHPRQEEVQYKNYFATSYTEIPSVIAHQLLKSFDELLKKLRGLPDDVDFSLMWPAIRQGIMEIIDVDHAEIYYRIGRECFEDAPPDAFATTIRLSPAEQDIVDVLREAGDRLSQSELLDLLSAKGKIPSVGTTKTMAAAMVRHRILTQGSDSHGKGYGLPEWD